MTIKLLIKIDVQTTEDAAPIERALCKIVSDALNSDAEVKDFEVESWWPRVLAIIDDVEVTVR